MYLVPKSRPRFFLLWSLGSFLKTQQRLCSTASPLLQGLCGIVSRPLGGLDDLEATLDVFKPSLTSSLVTQVIDSCHTEAPMRRLLRFFLWSNKNLKTQLGDSDYNHAIRVFAAKKDHTALEILFSDLKRDGRAMETKTYCVVAEALVKLGREDEALGMFKNLHRYQCPQDRSAVLAIITALCGCGHSKRAEGVLRHHKGKISGEERLVFRSLIYSWCEQENVKEARRVIKEMKSSGVVPDLFCYNAFLRCLCERNLKRNPSGLVPEALNVMMEMRSYEISPTSISYNVLLSCLGRARRVKESCQILERMKATGCCPDWMSYFLVIRVLYLSMRFGKGNNLLNEMTENGLVPSCRFYYDLIGVLCGVERPCYALELFDRMKCSGLGGYGPVYEVLIPKLCTAGEFEKGKELWDEAANMGVELGCSSDILDPSKTVVYKANKKEEEKRLLSCESAREDVKKSIINGSEKTSLHKKNTQKRYQKRTNMKKNNARKAQSHVLDH